MKFYGFVVVAALHFCLAASAVYTRLGCYKDSIFRTMSKTLSMNVKSVDECAELAKKRGYSTFGVQSGKECYSHEQAASKYKSQGASGNCRNGMGGLWANDVYQFSVTFKDLGCFKDNVFSRALPTFLGIFSDRSTSVRTCGDVAKIKGYSTFAVQFGGWCYSGENAATTYNKYGNSTNCNSDGTGGSSANNVYQLPNIGCYSCNGQSSCTKISCSQPFCYKMTSDREIGGQSSIVTIAGCMSNCTTDGKQQGCAGEKNCVLTCCGYEHCNDPNAKNNFPKCHYCFSNVSMTDCDAKSSLKTCKQEEGAQSYCTTTFNTITDPVTSAKTLEYKKDCSSNYLDCAIKGGNLCKGKSSAECSYKCCTRKACNQANEMRVSGSLILACALFMLWRML